MQYERKANYYETDQMAIVHHSNYIRWFEEARIEWMRKMGFPYELMEENGVQIPVLSVNCTYKSMVRFGETVLIQVKMQVYTGTRLTLAYQVKDKATGALRTEGSTSHCFILAQNGRVVSLKKVLPQAHVLLCAAQEEEI